MKITVAAVLFAGLALGACATKPERVQPLHISPLVYKTKSCEEIAQLMITNNTALTVTTDMQKRARRRDTIGVITLGLPMGSITGKDRESELARLKGEKIALEQAAQEKSCTAA
jgi:hypothetical protein